MFLTVSVFDHNHLQVLQMDSLRITYTMPSCLGPITQSTRHGLPAALTIS